MGSPGSVDDNAARLPRFADTAAADVHTCEGRRRWRAYVLTSPGMKPAKPCYRGTSASRYDDAALAGAASGWLAIIASLAPATYSGILCLDESGLSLPVVEAKLAPIMRTGHSPYHAPIDKLPIPSRFYSKSVEGVLTRDLVAKTGHKSCTLPDDSTG